MTYLELNGERYPAKIFGRQRDPDWNYRKSKSIELAMTYEDAIKAFVNGVSWNIVYVQPSYVNANGDTVEEVVEIYDNSEYDVAGSVTDNRDGTVTVKMGVMTAEEALAELQEVLAE